MKKLSLSFLILTIFLIVFAIDGKEVTSSDPKDQKIKNSYIRDDNKQSVFESVNINDTLKSKGPEVIVEPYILTPKASGKPRINGPKIFGVRPGNPFLFTIASTGVRPMKFSAKGLPEGLKLDVQSGRISGTVSKTGTYKVMLKAENKLGTAEREFRIVVGDKICLTPPMGWNSWYRWSESVSDEKVRQVARAMVEKGLVNHGWTYVNIDDCWQGVRGGKYNAIQGNERFPDMKGLCDYVHSMGLKAGIYSSPNIGTPAGFLGLSSRNEKGDYSDVALPEDQRPQLHQFFGRCPSCYKMGLCTPGNFWFGDKDAKQWVEWGFDYIKYDWPHADIPTMKQLEKDLNSCKRDIVMSISSGIPFENAPSISTIANLWRTTSDIQGNWRSISSIGFDQDKWRKFSSQGHWNDPDMLQIGMTGGTNAFVRTLKPTKLTPDEQYTQVSLWCLLAAPLLLSCDIESLDEFTLNLITNDEVLEINQDPLGDQAAPVVQEGQKKIWIKYLEDGSRAVGLFNYDEQMARIKVKWSDIGIEGKQNVRDLWRQKDLGVFTGEFETEVPSHGVVLVRIITGGV